MNNTLNGEIYKINNECDFWSRMHKKKLGNVELGKVHDEIELYLGLKNNSFAIYNSNTFGLDSDTEDSRYYDDELIKKVDRNGIRHFKKKSKHSTVINLMLKNIEWYFDIINPFEIHDIVGINNITGIQWIGDTLYYSVGDNSVTSKLINSEGRNNKYAIEPLIKVSYAEYLKHVTESITTKGTK